jgi:hypothetical protein
MIVWRAKQYQNEEHVAILACMNHWVFADAGFMRLAKAGPVTWARPPIKLSGELSTYDGGLMRLAFEHGHYCSE